MNTFPGHPDFQPGGGAFTRPDPKQQGPIQPGGFLARFAAVLIDGIILSVVVMPLGIVFVLLIGFSGAAIDPDILSDDNDALVMAGYVVVYYLIYFAVMFLYFGWFYKNKGATPGKMLFKLRVHHAESGHHIGYWHAFGREVIGKLISALPLLLGYIWAIFHPQKRAFHDLIFRTQVVRIS